MTTEIDLLPMPNGEAVGMYQAWSYDQMQAYARANIAHATATLQAEIEKLRADAERYRWLKKSAFCNVWARGDGLALVAPRTPVEDVDSKIDAAMEQEKRR